MEEIEPPSVEDAFGDLKDPRSRSPEHALSELLVVAIAAILSGADSWGGIATWGEAKIEWLRQYLKLANGVPSHDTFGRVLTQAQGGPDFIGMQDGFQVPAVFRQPAPVLLRVPQMKHRGGEVGA